MQIKKQFEIPSEDKIRELLNRNSKDFLFKDFVSNESAVDFLCDILYSSFKTVERENNGINVGLYGKASTGKTTLVKMFADALELPFLYLQADEIKNNKYLFESLDNFLTENYLYLTSEEKDGKPYYRIPPIIVFIDEVHALSSSMRDNLLPLFDRNTCTLSTSDEIIDCKDVYFFVATTDKGKIPKPLESRFTSVSLNEYSVAEVAEILSKKTGMDHKDCISIAKLTRIPRISLAFCEQVKLCSKRNNISNFDAINIVAARHGINEDGLDKKQINVMMFLSGSENGRSLVQLCNAVGVAEEEMKYYILPSLLMDNTDRKAFVSVSNKHFITDAGKEYLKIKGAA